MTKETHISGQNGLSMEASTLVAIRLAIPTMVPCSLRFPAQNVIGCQLFAELLKARVQLDGGHCDMAGSAAEFNNSLTLLKVADVFAAIASVRQVLEECGLMGASVIAYFCKAEGYWRSVHPHSGIAIDVEGEFEMRAEQGCANLERFKELHKLMERADRSAAAARERKDS